ncbi:MAG: monovalent cation/H(+) antiporter subunit G [Methanosarcinales archaeon]|nr:monovalent cation/H(+) antiporter subunit G [Methanosarcinales archaeon]MCD4815250.1 monovalent cation/H(+) antiporter subunit G [Methanosarcinales archaeon]
MFDSIIIIIVVLLLLIGLFFMLAGTIGFVRFPDFYSRMHATGKCDTLGEGLMLFALIIYETGYEGLFKGDLQHASFVSIKIILLILFILLANPTSTHAIAKAAHDVGLQPWKKTDETEWIYDQDFGTDEAINGGETK